MARSRSLITLARLELVESPRPAGEERIAYLYVVQPLPPWLIASLAIALKLHPLFLE
jgi:hypothetical protein